MDHKLVEAWAIINLGHEQGLWQREDFYELSAREVIEIAKYMFDWTEKNTKEW